MISLSLILVSVSQYVKKLGHKTKGIQIICVNMIPSFFFLFLYILFEILKQKHQCILIPFFCWEIESPLTLILALSLCTLVPPQLFSCFSHFYVFLFLGCKRYVSTSKVGLPFQITNVPQFVFILFCIQFQCRFFFFFFWVKFYW